MSACLYALPCLCLSTCARGSDADAICRFSGQDAVWQATQLVLPGPLGDAVAQLPACVAAESGGDAELMFGPALQGAASTEADAWLVSAGTPVGECKQSCAGQLAAGVVQLKQGSCKPYILDKTSAHPLGYPANMHWANACLVLVQAQSSAVVQRMTHLSQGQLAAACTAWLASVASDCQAAGPQILGASASAADLVQVEEAVRGAVAAWVPPSPASSSPDGNCADCTGYGLSNATGVSC